MAQDNEDLNSARDHLANERTYLAWVRTAIATMGFGVVIARLEYRLLMPPTQLSAQHPPPYVALIFLLVGLLIIAVATRRFLVVRREIIQQSFEPDTQTILTVSAAITMLGLFLLVCFLTNTL